MRGYRVERVSRDSTCKRLTPANNVSGTALSKHALSPKISLRRDGKINICFCDNYYIERWHERYMQDLYWAKIIEELDKIFVPKEVLLRRAFLGGKNAGAIRGSGVVQNPVIIPSFDLIQQIHSSALEGIRPKLIFVLTVLPIIYCTVVRWPTIEN